MKLLLTALLTVVSAFYGGGMDRGFGYSPSRRFARNHGTRGRYHRRGLNRAGRARMYLRKGRNARQVRRQGAMRNNRYMNHRQGNMHRKRGQQYRKGARRFSNNARHRNQARRRGRQSRVLRNQRRQRTAQHHKNAKRNNRRSHNRRQVQGRNDVISFNTNKEYSNSSTTLNANKKNWNNIEDSGNRQSNKMQYDSGKRNDADDYYNKSGRHNFDTNKLRSTKKNLNNMRYNNNYRMHAQRNGEHNSNLYNKGTQGAYKDYRLNDNEDVKKYNGQYGSINKYNQGKSGYNHGSAHGSDYFR